MLKGGRLPNAFGKQPSTPLINQLILEKMNVKMIIPGKAMINSGVARGCPNPYLWTIPEINANPKSCCWLG